MVDPIIIDPRWILSFRSDSLTNFFKLFPLLASDYFYITIIAIGFWHAPKSKIFRSLGFKYAILITTVFVFIPKKILKTR